MVLKRHLTIFFSRCNNLKENFNTVLWIFIVYQLQCWYFDTHNSSRHLCTTRNHKSKEKTFKAYSEYHLGLKGKRIWNWREQIGFLIAQLPDCWFSKKKVFFGLSYHHVNVIYLYQFFSHCLRTKQGKNARDKSKNPDSFDHQKLVWSYRLRFFYRYAVCTTHCSKIQPY